MRQVAADLFLPWNEGVTGKNGELGGLTAEGTIAEGQTTNGFLYFQKPQKAQTISFVGILVDAHTGERFAESRCLAPGALKSPNRLGLNWLQNEGYFATHGKTCKHGFA